jgi:hypothetical protein
MKAIKALLTKSDPKEQVRKWQATLRAEGRGIDRQIRGASETLGSLLTKRLRDDFQAVLNTNVQPTVKPSRNQDRIKT